MLITSRAAREQKLAELEAIADFGNLTADGRELLARLRRNDTIADAVSRLADIAPDVDGNARRGQYLHYMHGSLDCPGWGRHYARGTYVDRRGQRRSPDLQGCPRELRRLLAAPFCHDLDFVNSLPTVASQLDALGLCPSGHLTLLRHYCAHRSSWFDDIIAWHAIPAQIDATTTAKDAAKALPIRLLHGGSYQKWVKDFGVRDAGVSRGGGLPIIRDLQRQLKEVHAATVAAMRARRPQWTEALLQRKRLKKAGGRPLDSIPTQERERLERRALASAFAVIIQGHEDECLMTAVRVLQGGGWIVHSLQQDGVLAEPGRLAGGAPAAPLTALTPRVSQAIRAEHGLSIEMIEKDFHVASRDDPAIVSIVEGLALPLSPAQMPPRPQLPPVSARPVRPTAQQMFRSKASGAAAAARRAALLEARAEEAAARMGDTLLDARDADAAAIAAASAAQRAIADETADEGESGDEAGAPV